MNSTSSPRTNLTLGIPRLLFENFILRLDVAFGAGQLGLDRRQLFLLGCNFLLLRSDVFASQPVSVALQAWQVRLGDLGGQDQLGLLAFEQLELALARG